MMAKKRHLRISYVFLSILLLYNFQVLTCSAEQKICVLPLSSDVLPPSQIDVYLEAMSDEIFDIKQCCVILPEDVMERLESFGGGVPCKNVDCARKAGSFLEADIVVFGVVRKDTSGYSYLLCMLDIEMSDNVVYDRGTTVDDLELLLMSLMSSIRRLFNFEPASQEGHPGPRKNAEKNEEPEKEASSRKRGLRRFFLKRDKNEQPEEEPRPVIVPRDIIINHVPPEHVLLDKKLVLLVMTFLGGAENARVKVFYRFGSDDEWREKKMKVKDIRHYTSISYRKSKHAFVEYYFILESVKGDLLFDGKERIYRVDLP